MSIIKHFILIFFLTVFTNQVFSEEIKKRRTFGIISHPDAGKTTLTEKLLLFGGAIQMAGAIKARKAGRHATSDWMKVEQERGISVTTSVMKFGHRDCEINLLDTPGHQDFSEDTYRVLAAVDADWQLALEHEPGAGCVHAEDHTRRPDPQVREKD